MIEIKNAVAFIAKALPHALPHITQALVVIIGNNYWDATAEDGSKVKSEQTNQMPTLPHYRLILRHKSGRRYWLWLAALIVGGSM